MLLAIKYSLLSILTLLFFHRTSVASNDGEVEEFVKSENIKSVKIIRKGWDYSEPAIELGSNDKVYLCFDDISENPETYSYSILHCNYDWSPSNLFYTDYMTGFEANEIRNYSYASGTTFSYVNYELEIPNEDVQLKISGNYIIRIFNPYEPDSILMQKKFIVYEPISTITASVRQPTGGTERFDSQQLDLKVSLKGLRISDPNSEIKTIVCQNNLFASCETNIKPTHISGNELDYSHPEALIFKGGNEFRIFDLKNLRYNSKGVKSIDYYGGMFHAQLESDQSRRNRKYSYYADFNGRFIINLEQSDRSNTEADYVWTYFSLETPMELDSGKSVYIFGELTGWQLSPEFRLNYNYSRESYETRILLKQGVYSYRYLVVDNDTEELDITHFEGSFFETENSYSILIYYKPFGSRYDRIVGYKSFSTLK